MKERPIIFKAEMVNAILDGRKTQTRRIVKNIEELPNGFITPKAGFAPRSPENHIPYCPQGKPGDRLWVRENHAFDIQLDHMKSRDLNQFEPVFYHANEVVRTCSCSMIAKGKTRPSIFMPRWASRINLEITNIRVERLNEISEADSRAEGIDESNPFLYRNYMEKSKAPGFKFATAICSFLSLWESINGKESINSNPWVWVIEFRKL